MTFQRSSTLATALLTLLFSVVTYSNSNKMIVNLSLSPTVPPYLLEDSQDAIELKIIQAALFSEAHLITNQEKPPNTIIMLGNEKPEGYKHQSNVFITYEDVAISLQQANHHLENSKQLMQHRVSAFPMAAMILDNALNEVAIYNSEYQETHIIGQIRALFSGSSDFIISDTNTFQHAIILLQQATPTSLQNLTNAIRRPTKLHHLYTKTEYRLGSKNKSIIGVFNQGLERIHAQGTYTQLWRNHIKQGLDTPYTLTTR